MADVTSLDDVLSDEKPPAPADDAPPADAPSGEAPAGDVERVTSRRAAHRTKELAAQGRGPDGKFLPKEEPAPAAAPAAPAAEVPAAAAKPPAQDMTDKEKAAFATAADERRKRQALEAELAKYRQPAAPGAQPAAPTAAEKKFWDDPEGFLADWRTKTLGEAQQATVHSRLQTSEMLARYRYKDAGDFDANIAEFAAVVQSTPGLAQQWLAAGDPAEFAYRTGKTHREIKEVGSIDAMREKMEKEIRAKVEAEVKAKQEEERKARAAIPQSLSDIKGATTQQRSTFTGPTPLDAILKP